MKCIEKFIKNRMIKHVRRHLTARGRQSSLGASPQEQMNRIRFAANLCQFIHGVNQFELLFRRYTVTIVSILHSPLTARQVAMWNPLIVRGVSMWTPVTVR